MKNLIVIVLLAALVSACDSKSGTGGDNKDTLKSQQESSITPENFQKVEFKVEGMSCAGCENAIKGSMEKCAGVKVANASFTAGNTVIEYDKTKTNIDTLKKAIENDGYTVTGCTLK